MKVTVFGANGQVGTKVVSKLLESGHSVRAAVHGAYNFPAHKALDVITADIHKEVDVKHALGDSRAVISTLGSWGTKSKDILSAGMANIIPAMESSGVKRIVSLTGAAAFDELDKPHLIDQVSRLALKVLAKKVLRDSEQHLALLRSSSLDWTVVRSPLMREKGAPGHYRLLTNAPKPWETIVRDDVASALVRLATSDEWLKSAPYIHRLP